VPQNVPTVLVGARPRAGGINSVALDDEGAGCIAAGHLVNLGHRRIALLTGPLAEDCSQDRQDGYQACLRAVSVEPDPALVIEGDWTATSGYNAVRHWLEAGVAFTGLFAQNDRMAIGAIRALHEAGLRVPEDVSVVGFDDMPLASYFYPSLTTVRQDMLAIGAEAARLLIEAVENPEAACQHLRMTVELVVRESTSICKS
jgi:DNA-binding LacI/PurR family transcriptional regulator